MGCANEYKMHDLQREKSRRTMEQTGNVNKERLEAMHKEDMDLILRILPFYDATSLTIISLSRISI